MISYDDFKKLDLRAVRILAADRVAGSEKLVKLLVDCGDSDEAGLSAGRQIVAGIGKVYSPEELVGRGIVIVANLEPRLLMGLESQGMLLAADEEGMPVLLKPDREVKPGSTIK